MSRPAPGRWRTTARRSSSAARTRRSPTSSPATAGCRICASAPIRKSWPCRPTAPPPFAGVSGNWGIACRQRAVAWSSASDRQHRKDRLIDRRDPSSRSRCYSPVARRILVDPVLLLVDYLLASKAPASAARPRWIPGATITQASDFPDAFRSQSSAPGVARHTSRLSVT